MDKSEALRLADELERDKWHVPAVVMQASADELRRLSAVEARVLLMPSEQGETNETTTPNKEDNATTTSLHRSRISPPYAIGVAS